MIRHLSLDPALALVGLALATWSCADRVVMVIPELPEGPGYVGLLYHRSGQPWIGTGLRRVDGFPSLVSASDPADPFDEIELVYFSEEHLRSITSEPEEALQEARLFPPTKVGRAVAPSFSAGGVPGPMPWQLSRRASPTLVSASWAGSCAVVLPETPAPVEVSCAVTPCAIRARQEGCTVQIYDDFCGYVATGDLTGLGTVELELGRAIGTCHGAIDADERLRTFDCMLPPADIPQIDTCTLRVHTEPDVVPDLGVKREQLVSVNYHPTLNDENYVRSLIVEPDRLLVLRSSSGEPVSLTRCAQDSNLELVHLSPGDLQVTASLPVRPCLIRMIPSAVPGRYFALFAGEPGHVGVVSERGETVALRELPTQYDGIPLEPVRVSFDESTRTVVVAARLTLTSAHHAMLLLLLDADTLEPRSPPLYFPENAPDTPAWSATPGHIDVLRHRYLHHTISLEDGSERLVSNLEATCGRFRVSDILPLAEGRLIVASRARMNDFVVVSDGPARPCRRSSFWEDVRSPSALASWPSDPNLVLVGLTRKEERIDGTEVSLDAALSFFDLARGRFLWPSQEVGLGLVEELSVHPDGTIFGLLPMEGVVLRVHPR